MGERHATLELIARLAEQRGSLDVATEVREAQAGLERGLFNVVFVGQHKRGKSTLINALLGREWLPADVQPVTSAVTIVEHGATERVVVRFDDGLERAISPAEIPELVSEGGNPGNSKGVRAVVLELPVALLAAGVRLVDTPGVGSVFAANSEVTRGFIPRVDVGVVVLGCDPPISGEERDLVAAVAAVAGRLVFVLGKSDRHVTETRDKAEAFTRRVIAQTLGADPGPLLHLSARRALREGGDAGVEALRSELAGVARQQRSTLAAASAARTARDLGSRLMRSIEIEAAALRMPLTELDRRVAEFSEAINDVDDLTLAVSTRVRSGFFFDWSAWKEREEAFVADATARAEADLQARLAGHDGGRGEPRRQVVEHARALTTSLLSQWKTQSDNELRAFHEAHAARVDAEVGRLARRMTAAAARAFGTTLTQPQPFRPTLDEHRFELDLSEPKLALDLSSSLAALADRVLPAATARRRVVARVRALADDWLRRGLNEIDQRLVDELGTFTRTLDAAAGGYLDAMRRDLLDAVESGRRRQHEGDEAVAGRLAALAKQRASLAGALECLAEG